MAKGKKKKPARKPYTAGDIKLLKQHSKARTPVPKIARLMKRTEGSLRQKALKLRNRTWPSAMIGKGIVTVVYRAGMRGGGFHATGQFPPDFEHPYSAGAR